MTDATSTMSSSSHGFVVRVAAAARPSAHTHQATGCRSRGSRATLPVPLVGGALVLIAASGPAPPRQQDAVHRQARCGEAGEPQEQRVVTAESAVRGSSGSTSSASAVVASAPSGSAVDSDPSTATSSSFSRSRSDRWSRSSRFPSCSVVGFAVSLAFGAVDSVGVPRGEAGALYSAVRLGRTAASGPVSCDGSGDGLGDGSGDGDRLGLAVGAAPGLSRSSPSWNRQPTEPPLGTRWDDAPWEA